MNKRAGIIFKIVFIIILAVVLLIAGVGIYFYKYHVYRVIRICISNDEVQDTTLPCIGKQECIEIVMQVSEEGVTEIPEFFKEDADMILDKAIFCDQTCKIKNIYYIEDSTESCQPGEEEIAYEINGQQMIQIIKYMEDTKLD